MADVKQRNVGMAIFLSIITCGIYGIYWEICLVNDLNTVCNDGKNTGGGKVFLLSLITCNIYWWVWIFTAGNRLDTLKAKHNLPTQNRGFLYLILTALFLGIIPMALIQNDINEFVLSENEPGAVEE